MKVEVTSDEILFKRFLFTVTIPKNGNEIEYRINNESRTIGVVQFMVIPKIYKVGIFGKILMCMIYLSQLRRTYFPFSMAPLTALTLKIEKKKDVMEFFDNAKLYGYDIDDAFRIYTEATVEHKLIPGTKAFKEDSLSLALILPIFFEIVALLVIFTSDHIKNVTISAINVTIFNALFCYGIYYLLMRRK